MRERVTIKTRTNTVDAHGQPVATYTELATVWAKRSPQSAKEATAANQTVAANISTFHIRYRADITESDRLVWNDWNHDITGIEILGANEFLRIQGKRTSRAESTVTLYDYFRPDGSSQFRQPDGTSTYKRSA